jgi:hypothetical protein
MPGTTRSLYDFTRFDAEGDPLVELKKWIQRQESGLSPTSVAGQFNIPAYDTVDFTYVNGGAADDDKIATQTFKKDGATVAVLTYAYVGSTNNIQSITQS